MKKTLILATMFALATTIMPTTIAQAATDTQQPNCQKSCPAGPPPEFRGKDRRKADFENRLKLTDKQKAQIKKNHEKDKTQMKPLMDQIKQKEMAKIEIFKKYELKDPDLIKLNNELKALREKRHKIMEQNRKSFEAILTKEQKQELQKMKSEREKIGPRHPAF